MNFSYKLMSGEIEKTIREFWSTLHKQNPKKKTYFHLETFPYPSSTGLHIGHPLGYIASDIHVRYMRMQGYEVLYPFGFDSFGLPAEQYAIKTGQHPKITTEQNIQNFIKQLHVLSLSYDWDRMISTCDPSYYKWTQWIFLKLYDSFFDPTEVWEDGFGHQLIGRAKPISVLIDYIKTGKWHIDPAGIPKPGKSHIQHSHEAIQKSIDHARLAYLGKADVNWCPGLGTVLANEEVTKDKRSERGNFPVEKRSMKQWMLRITAYADRLINGLDTLDWPEKTITMQKNWIGRSLGVEIMFKAQHDIKIFTTRPDTILGVTFIAVAQDYPVYGVKLAEDEAGRFTGKYAFHPITGDKIPIWVTNYVLGDYGTGAVMGVPAHDARDFEFAKQHNIEIAAALMPSMEWLVDNVDPETTDLSDLQTLWLTQTNKFMAPFVETGPILSAEQLSRPEISFRYFEDKEAVIDYLESMQIGIKQVNYKLRDWVFSRQRYWGEPIPIVYDEHGHAYALDESELPLHLPETVDFQPLIGATDPVPPLGRCTEWIKIQGEIIDGKVVTQNLTNPQTFYREASTMPNWAGSSWYYLRYLDPHNDKELIGKEALNHYCKGKYATVDLYVIGAEHTVLHLLYARFWHLFLFDMDYVPNPEPWKRMLHQGMITANAYTDENGSYVDVSDVEYDGKVAHQKSTGKSLNIIQGKMGKSYKNGIPPEEICAQYSTDVFRLHTMYMAPVTQTREWHSETIVGMERFCQSVCRVVQKAVEVNLPQSGQKVQIKLHHVIKVATEHYDAFHINTAISSMIELCNMAEGNLSVQDCVTFLTLLAPCAPHLCEYWYQEIRKAYPAYCQTDSILACNWPSYDQNILNMSLINIPVQINNKLKFVLEVPQDITEGDITQLIRDKIDSIDKYRIIIAIKAAKVRAINLVTK